MGQGQDQTQNSCISNKTPYRLHYRASFHALCMGEVKALGETAGIRPFS